MTSGALISAAGFDGSDLIYAKKLALENGGQVDMIFDGDEINVSLTVPYVKPDHIRSTAFDRAAEDLSKAVARILAGL